MLPRVLYRNERIKEHPEVGVDVALHAMYACAVTASHDSYDTIR